MNKRIIVSGFIVLAAAVLIWIGISRHTNKPTQQDAQLLKTPLKVGIVVYPSFGMFYVAQEKGFFQKEGVDVDTVQISDENQLVSALASNQVQMLIATPDSATIVADAGIDAPFILATDIGYGSDGLIVKNDVNDISQLKGKKIYLSFGQPSHFLFRYWSQEARLKSSDVEIINTTADQVGASFVAGKIDYGMTWEPWLSKVGERKDGKVLITSRDTPGVLCDGIIVRRDFLEKHRDEVRSFIRAYFEAVDFWKNNKDEANAIIAKNFNIAPEEFAPMMDTVKLLDYDENIKKFNSSSGFNIYDLTNKAIGFYSEDGILKTRPDANNLIDPSLLNELYQ